MFLGILNKKISTEVGILVILLIAVLAGWIMVRQYKKIVELRFEALQLEMFEK